MTSDYIFKEEFAHILAALMPQNRLAMEVSLATGLRIGDVLALKTSKLKQRMTVREQKTGKNRRVALPNDLYKRLLGNAGRIYVFEHRTDEKRHRTRQAVYKDIKRTAKLFRIPRKLIISPHSARKIYAVDSFKRLQSIEKVQRLLNHSREAVTVLYAMADVLTERRCGDVLRRCSG